MADTAKSRLQNSAYIFQPGEHIWVHSTFFDDPKVPVEERYSVILGGDGRCPGIVRKRMGCSYMIDFDDDSTASVPAIEVMPTKREREHRIADQNDPSDSDDEDYYPHDEEAECKTSEDECNYEPIENEGDENVVPLNNELKQMEEVYLCRQGKDIFKANYHLSDDNTVHGKELDSKHGRFFITKVLKDASKWKEFDVDVHCKGSPVMWAFDDIRRVVRKTFSKLGTEATFATPLLEKKRKRNEKNWQTVKRKNALNSGKKFVWKKKNGKEVDCGRDRYVKDRCGRQVDDRIIECRKKWSSISDEERVEIHQNYWKGSDDMKRAFLLKHVTVVDKDRTRKRKDKENVKTRNRDFTRKYSFTVSGSAVSVCAKFFYSTLDIDEKRVHLALQASSGTGSFGQSERGKHDNHYTAKERELLIVEHISKFKTVESHYVRKSAKCQYLPMELSIKEMHRMYVEDHNGVGNVENYSFYKGVFHQKFNLKFQKNKKDKCNTCEAFNNTPVDCRTEEQTISQDQHHEEKENAREFKELKKREGEKKNVISVAFDLQKVMLCPHGQTSSFYYSKRMKVHNFTITDITTMFTYCHVWHEGDANKGSAEVGSCLQKFLASVRSEGIDEVNLFADRCGGQNSNRMVIIALHEMFLKLKFEKIGMNFLVTGHSQNDNDNAHSQIEQKTRMRKIYTPDEWAAAIQMSFKANKVNVERLVSDEIVDFKDKESFSEYTALLNDSTKENDEASKDKKSGKIYWSKVMQYHFVKTHPNKLFFKYNYSAPQYKFATIHKKTQTRISVVSKQRRKLYQDSQGIDQSKKVALLKLCHEILIPQCYRSFYENLKVKKVVRKMMIRDGDNSDSETDTEVTDST